MQPLNDDMDNLFRQAADGYPLNTSGANFEKVRQQADAVTPAPEKKEPKRRYLWLLLLLLVPLPFLLRHYQANPTLQYSQNNTKHNAANHSNHLPAPTADTNGNTIRKEVLIKKSNKDEPVSNTPDSLQTQQPETVKVQMKADGHVEIFTNKNIVKQQLGKNKNQVTANQTGRQSTITVNKNDRKLQTGNESGFLQSGIKSINSNSSDLSGKKDNGQVNEKLIKAKPADVVMHADTATGKYFIDNTTKTVALKKIADSANVFKKNNVRDSADKVASKPTSENKTKAKPVVYIGIITGPDFSTVKSKQIGGAGYNLGFLAGYKTGKHLAFETGILLDNKRYHAKGKDVKTEKLGLPSHTQLLYLNGTCDMIEIPLNVRYHFNSKTAGNFYAGAGVSSYIMKKETYNYKSKRYNMEYYQKREYANTSNNWLSVLQLTAGYEINFKNRSSLRIEPYAKLPLKGIGIGKLPLTSAGINMAFTMPVHN